MRKRLASDRPDWPRYMVRNINPTLWQRVIDRAKAASRDGSPRLNGIILHLLEYYAASGLPALPGFPTPRPSVSPSTDPSVSPQVPPALPGFPPDWSTDPSVDPIVHRSARPTANPDTSDKE